MAKHSSPGSCYIGIDVGGTKILGVVVDPDGWQEQTFLRHPTPIGDTDRLAIAIGDVVEELIELSGRPAAVGVGVPGLVDHAGVLRYGPNVPGVLGLDIAGDLKRRFGLDVTAANDGTNAAVAEHRLGAAVGHDNAVIVAQGTGIAGGLIIGGKVATGANGFAGEPGHMLVAAAPDGSDAGHVCACGRAGCWEAVSSGAGLANIAKALVEEGKGSGIVALAGGEVAHVRGEHLAEAMDAGDPDAKIVFDRFATWVARGVASLVSLLDPSIVVLGGGLAQISDHFIVEVRERIVDYTIGAGYRPEVPVVAAKFGKEAGAIGAAIMAHDRFPPS